MLTALAGLALGLFARAWLLTLRVRVIVHPSLDVGGSSPWVLCLWHGQLLLLLAHRRRRRTAALVSWSRDGEMLAWALRWFGLVAERGSSSRGGRAGLRAMVVRLCEGKDAAFAVDGPRGPSGVARPGALAAARNAGGWVVPYAAACSRSVVLRSWDRFEVPLPFSRVAVVLGPAWAPGVHETGTECLAMRIDAATRLAQDSLRARTPSLPCFDKVTSAPPDSLTASKEGLTTAG